MLATLTKTFGPWRFSLFTLGIDQYLYHFKDKIPKEERAEQKVLRAKYINSFKASLESQLSGITIVEPDGSKHKVTKKGGKDAKM